jgi:formyltetrahydrofolate synthetase
MTEKLDEIINRLARLETKTDINFVLLEETRQALKDHVVSSKEHEKYDQLRFEKVGSSLDRLEKHVVTVRFFAVAVVVVAPIVLGLFQTLNK